DEDDNGIPDCFECRPWTDDACPAGTWCSATRTDYSFLYRCVPAGARDEGERCSSSDECGEGLACSILLRRCARSCGSLYIWPSCPDGLECPDAEDPLHPDTRGFPVCLQPCDPTGERTCGEGFACSPDRS